MKYEVTQPGNPTEALGAHSGYRIRLVATRDDGSATYTVRALFRGSESMPENAVPIAKGRFETVTQALDAGYAAAVEWIDREDCV